MSEITFERIAALVDSVPTVTVSVESTVDIPAEIFKYKVSSTGQDQYTAVCTLQDLSTLGTVRAGGVAFYRKSSAAIAYDSLSEAIEGKSDLVDEIQALLDAFQLANGAFLGTDNIRLEA
jgi:hypothetical protein